MAELFLVQVCKISVSGNLIRAGVHKHTVARSARVKGDFLCVELASTHL